MPIFNSKGKRSGLELGLGLGSAVQCAAYLGGRPHRMSAPGRHLGLLLQEVIQNAEDAGATKVTFLIDGATYGGNAELLYDPHLADHQVTRSIKHLFCAAKIK